MNEGVGTETRGGGAKLFSQFCRLLNSTVPVNRAVVVGITHLIANTSGMGAQLVERAARMWTYQCDYQLRARKKEAWKTSAGQVGLVVDWACNTSPLGPPGMTIDSYLRFGVGIDRLYECLVLGAQAGLVKKNGSWLTLEFLGRERHKHLLGGEAPPKAQGEENLYRMLVARPEWAEALRSEVAPLGKDLAGVE
jgi:hypothetical protein